MKEDFVDFETAILLEKKDFLNIPQHTYFVGDDKQRGCAVGDFIGHPSKESDTHLIDAPTPQMTMKWLRMKGIIITISYNRCNLQTIGSQMVYEFKIQKDDGSLLFETTEFAFEFYEEAAEYAIKHCLTNLVL